MSENNGSGSTMIVAIVAVIAIAVIAFLVLSYTKKTDDGINVDLGGSAAETDIVPDGQ